MKKLITILLAVSLMCVFVACGNTATNDGGSNGGGTSTEITDANSILTAVWEKYNASVTDEDMKIPVGGGNVETMVMDAPATYDMTLEGALDTLTVSFCVPMDGFAMIDDAATMMNMMMANNFTCAAYHVREGSNPEMLVAMLKETTLNNQWMCGMPERYVVFTIQEDYIISVFGNGQIMEAFVDAVESVYGDAAKIVVDENLM